VCQQTAGGGAQLLQSQRSGVFRPFGLDCGRHCLDAFIQPPADSFVVALAARRSWFCCRRLVAVLLEFGRRRAGLAEKAAPGRAFSWPRACGC
jgi:hypothetical protein